MSTDQSARQNTVRKHGEGIIKDPREADETQLGRRIRELAADLARDVLGAVAMASAHEIGELITTVEHNRARDRAQVGLDGPSADHAADWSTPDHASLAPGRAPRPAAEARSVPASPKGRARPNGRTGPLRRVSGQDHRTESERDEKSLLGHADPFDITSPGELLASTGEQLDSASPARPGDAQSASQLDTTADVPPTPPERTRDLSAATPFVQPSPADSATAMVNGDSEAASERRPKVVLRAGERLLSATGSGVVIRRERRIAPPR